MSVKLDQIKHPVAKELLVFEDRFRDAMRSNVALLDKITWYIVKSKGKQLRPLIVLLCAKLHGQLNENSYVAASLVELLHTATLVHDDVVDDANERRGFFSINALWKNKVAVLVGDFLLSQGLSLSIETGQVQMLQIVSKAVKEMAEGELLQMEKARRLDIDESTYFEIIRQKTASLIAAASQAGTSSTSKDPEILAKMHLFGEKAGIAFQIRDDLFDFGDAQIGKPTGIDIKEKKLTLPLIRTLHTSDAATRKRIIHIVKNESTKPEKVQEVIRLVRASDGLAYAREAMLRYRDEAAAILMQFEENDARTALRNLLDYVIEREK
jgi:octaprenyl-diphosphate synthase